MEKQRKTEVIETFRVHETDSGSPEVQIALLTERINELTGHLRTHQKDHVLAARPAEDGGQEVCPAKEPLGGRARRATARLSMR